MNTLVVSQKSATQVATIQERSDWDTLSRLMPFVWRYKWRALSVLALLVMAKIATVSVPLLLKQLVDSLNPSLTQAIIVVPAALLVGYGVLRVCSSWFTEACETVFSKATEGISRSISLQVFRHLHGLSLRFHLERQTGGMTRDIERGTSAVRALISFALFRIVPTLLEMAFVLTLLALKFDQWFAWITLAALTLYIVFTIGITQWRTQFRKKMNEMDGAAHSRAIDSLLNYETVKYFNNEAFEAKRYDENLARFHHASAMSQRSLSYLNGGQQLIIAVALVAMLWRATQGVVDGRLTLGDLVMINAFMIQLYIPLNFLGTMYREIKQSLTDLDKMFTLLEKEREIADVAGAEDLQLWHANAAAPDADSPAVSFNHVHFAYDPMRPILHGVSFQIPAGKTVAVVGPSGAGKSTLARLLYRFYDVQQGSITIAGQDIKNVTQASVRQAIGIVPQDTVLFNDTIAYNIAYGKTSASKDEIIEAAKSARIHDFIAATPLGYETTVGERGLKLSGGEKQRVAIARTLLKNPPILIFDEATSALDSANERAIQAELHSVAQNKTTLVIAHRLSTVVDAHEIIVMDAGHIVERGNHSELLAKHGVYATMWALQQQSSAD